MVVISGLVVVDLFGVDIELKCQITPRVSQ